MEKETEEKGAAAGTWICFSLMKSYEFVRFDFVQFSSNSPSFPLFPFAPTFPTLSPNPPP